MGFENWLELLLDLERRNCIDFGWNQEKSEKCGLKVRSRPLPLIKGPLLSTNDYNHLFLSKLQSFDQNWLKKMVVPPIQTWNQVFHAIAYAFQSLALFRNHFFFLVIISDLHSAWKSKKSLIFFEISKSDGFSVWSQFFSYGHVPLCCQQ